MVVDAAENGIRPFEGNLYRANADRKARSLIRHGSSGGEKSAAFCLVMKSRQFTWRHVLRIIVIQLEVITHAADRRKWNATEFTDRHHWPERAVGFQMFFQFFQGSELCFATASMALNEPVGTESRVDLLLLFRQQRVRGEFNVLREVTLRSTGPSLVLHLPLAFSNEPIPPVRCSRRYHVWVAFPLPCARRSRRSHETVQRTSTRAATYFDVVIVHHHGVVHRWIRCETSGRIHMNMFGVARRRRCPVRGFRFRWTTTFTLDERDMRGGTRRNCKCTLGSVSLDSDLMIGNDMCWLIIVGGML